MVKVTVLGAAGGIGQPLSLLLKLHPKIEELSLFDVVNVPGVSADLSHINSDANITHHKPSSREDKTALKEALQGTDIVIIPAGVPRKPGMTRDDLFNFNAGIVRSLAQGIAEAAPSALVLVITNPVNSTVAIVKDVFVKAGVYNPKKLCGVTSLDVVRSNTFLAGLFPGEIRPSDLSVNVIGGHSGETIVPIYLQGAAAPFYERLSKEDREKLYHRVRFAGDEVVAAKDGAGLATLSMAYAGYRLADRILQAFDGKDDVVECAFVDLTGTTKGSKEARELTGCHCFALPVKWTKDGIEEIEYEILENVTSDEQKMLDVAIEQLKANIEKGENFVKNN